jgi:hypothetical protein
MVQRPDWSQLKIKRQYRPDLKPFYHDDLIAYDTETWQGKAVLICDSKGNHCYPETLTDCLLFLTRRKYRDIMGWFKNINYDVEAILKFCDEKTVREFAKTNEMEVPFNDTSFFIKYIPGKMFKVIFNKHSFVFFDIGNFLKGSLNDLGKKYLKDTKNETPVDWKTVKKRQLFTLKMRKYCLQDAALTEGLARVFLDACNGFGIFSKNYCSPASLATHYFMSKIDIPTLHSMTQGKKLRAKLAYNAYKGGFITTFKKGRFDHVYLYDINSAYPDQMTRLPDMTRGRFKFGLQDIPTDATMGWMECIIETEKENFKPYYPAYFSPVPVYVKKLNKNYYFVGKVKTTITLLEYQALKNDFKITPTMGIYWIPTDEPVYLYRDIVNELYHLKSEYKTGDKNYYALIKILLNGFYGKTIQKIPVAESREFNTGNLFNPFHASYITAGCRIQVYEFIKRHGALNVIGVMTDGVAYEKPVKEPLSKDLGAWGLDMEGEAVFIGSGLYTIRDKVSGKVKTATRGFKTTDRLDFFDMLYENKDRGAIELSQTVRLTYKEALRVKKFVDWNLIKDGIKRININCDNKRIWAGQWATCGDVLTSTVDSAPYFVNMTAK